MVGDWETVRTPLRPRWTASFLISERISEEAIVRM